MAAEPITEPDDQSSLAELRNALAWSEVQREVMQESILQLEQEMYGWRQLNESPNWTFSRTYLDRVIELARLSALRNPLISHAVEVNVFYVMGQGVNWKAAEPVRPAIEAFWTDPANRAEITSPRRQLDLERARVNDGNLFLALFTSGATGRVKVRSLPVHEIREIICDPDDWRSPWFYRRQWESGTLNDVTGETVRTQHEAFYPDWRYHPTSKPATIAGKPVNWDAPVYHVSSGGLPHQLWGLPETYPALDWARAVKNDLEDYATVKRSLAKFAWQMTGPKTKSAVAAAHARLSTNASIGGVLNTNPPGIPGSTFIGMDGYSMTPIKTAGGQPSPDEGRRLWLMVAAGVGLPETILSGDADVGNLATAKTLDRPTELKMAAQQSFWEEVFTDLLNYVIDQAILAPRGMLRGLGTLGRDDDGNPIVVMRTDPKTGEPVDRKLDLDFPNILDRDINSRIAAIVDAATLGGNPPAGTMTPEQVTTQLLTELGFDDVQAEVEKVHPPDATAATPQPEEALMEALRELRAAIVEGR